ncbi:LPS translocon maturation chaperone LptM [Herbaspirillum camelliae]|uniref:LPS translocon maturation chaperone LptM n=1 Tax=Herbaspirillum camelliae TaxID=1892903 RepID=UPI000949D0A7|nr:lipoprotein [Herbaspirillum camelliae]
MKSHSSLARRSAALALCSAVLMLAGCGQKGPLFMPKTPPDPFAQTQPQSQSKPAESPAAASEGKRPADPAAGKQ